MKVYFSCTTIKFAEYKDLYYEIRDFLVDEGHVLTRDWLSNMRNNPQDEEARRNGSKEIYDLTLTALGKAEALIVENTVESFSSGHLITIALQRRVPVLVLQKNTEPRYFPRTLIHGIEDKFLQVIDYKGKEYIDIIRKFLHGSQQMKEKHHFHLVIDGEEKAYLDWLKFNKNKAQTETIRTEIKKLIEEDHEYYLYQQSLLPKH